MHLKFFLNITVYKYSLSFLTVVLQGLTGQAYHLCGDHTIDFQSVKNAASVDLVTNQAVTDRGFSLSYQLVCTSSHQFLCLQVVLPFVELSHFPYLFQDDIRLFIKSVLCFENKISKNLGRFACKGWFSMLF